MAALAYAEEGLRVLHESSSRSCTTLLQHADATALALAINQLEKREQVVLALVYFEGFDVREVAGILDISAEDSIRAHAFAVFALISQFAKIGRT